MVKKDQLCGIALKKRNWILKVLLKMVAMETNQNHPEVVYYSIDANASCSFTKQDLIVK